ncbi:MAG: hypothetical protein IPP61_19485 [Cytophagaceae bacterium]|nr:hypothetical protein [Cytophagaceae bacterium]MBL0327311.1 hypothetical protein [Cytophagaceae bacterium]
MANNKGNFSIIGIIIVFFLLVILLNIIKVIGSEFIDFARNNNEIISIAFILTLIFAFYSFNKNPEK